MAKAEKEVKDKSKDEIVTDMLNYHISKGTLKASQVKEEHKDKLK